MVDLNGLSDRELREKALSFGIDVPVTQSTRSLVIRKVKAVMEAAGNGSTSHRQTQQHEEPAESRPSSVRRRSAAPAPKPKTTRQQRMSLAPPATATDDSDGQDDMPPAAAASNLRKPSPNRNNTPLIQKSGKQSLNGNSENVNNSHPSDQMSDEELLKQLAKYKIPAPAITFSTRPLLIKKLNHAMAKSKRESKSFKAPSPVISRPKPVDTDTQESEQESDCTDNASVTIQSSLLSTKDRRSTTPASLTFSHQHSVTMGNNSLYSLNNSSLLTPSRQPDFNSKAYIPTPRPVINRFVEEQEPYDTGSDSEADNGPIIKPTPQKRNWSLGSWFIRKTTTTPTANQIASSTPVKKPTTPMFSNLKGKLNIIWQWQFIALVLPALAFLFFLFLAAFYIKASYTSDLQLEAKVNASVDPVFDRLVQNVKSFLENDAVSKLCNGLETVSHDSSQIIEQLNIDQTRLDKVKEVAMTNTHLGIVVEDDSWSVPSARLPLWCLVKTYLWNLLLVTLFLVLGVGGVFIVHYVVTANARQREKEEQEVYSMVEMIIDLLARHQSAMQSERRPQDAYLAVTHVRDVLIPLKERKTKIKLWNKAVQFLEENESRVRPEIQQIEGEDFRVWRWLPPSTTFSSGSKGASGSTTLPIDQTDDPSLVNSPIPRPKVWQGQAFSTDTTGVNSPLPYPLTQCLKVRNMFDSEMEVGESWPVRIQDAILEKSEKAKILHIAVDKCSREGCVYIKCTSADEAGKVYRALHGWWFDGNLVTVKYLRPERYHYRFPDSLTSTVPMQPSNDKRLSLQTKYWKSPLENF